MADLPVGRHLQNHYATYFNISFAKSDILSSIYYNLTDRKFETYLRGVEDGVLSAEGSGPQAFFVSDIAKSAGESNWPDIQFLQLETTVGHNGLPSVMMEVCLVRPKSVGRLKLNTKKYLKGEREDTRLTLLDYNLFGHDQDKPRLIDGMKKVLRIFNTNVFKQYGVKIVPDGPCVGSNFDAYLACYVERYTMAEYHSVGTCRMGHGSDEQNSVVDSKFK